MYIINFLDKGNFSTVLKLSDITHSVNYLINKDEDKERSVGKETAIVCIFKELVFK